MKHRLLELKSGDFTLVEEAKGQSMHSRIGPKSEAAHIYLSHPRLEHLLQTQTSEPAVIWDVGMGLAANPLLLLEKFKTRARPIEFWSFENDLDGIKTALAHLDSFPFLKTFAHEIETLITTGKTKLPNQSVTWHLLTGDFREVAKLAPSPDLLFYDFYDPRTCRELWQASTLVLSKAANKPSLLLTYVSATWVRIELLRAGFFVGQGRPTPVKDETTQAANELSLLENPLPKSWLEHKRKTAKNLNLTDSDWKVLFAHPQFKL